MVETGVIVITFVLFFISAAIAIYYLEQNNRLAVPPENPNDPDLVQCSEADVLESWIRNVANRPVCPVFTNNLVVSNDPPTLFEKQFQINSETDCCFYSNNQDQRTRVPFPFIVIGNLNKTFSLGELNEKAYIPNGNQIIYFVPACDNDPNCLGLVRIGLLDNQTSAIYRVYRFQGNSTIEVPIDTIPNPDNSAAIALLGVIEFNENARRILSISLEDELLCKDNGGTLECVPDLVNQPLLQTLKMLSDNRQFAAVAAVNPPLSEALQNT